MFRVLLKTYRVKEYKNDDYPVESLRLDAFATSPSESSI